MPAQPLSLPPNDNPGAPFLFSDDTILELTDQEKRGIYTAARCPTDKKRAILTLLKEGRSLREVAALVTSVKEETVKAVYDTHALEIDQARQMSSKILPKARYALDLQLNRLIESPSSVPFASVGLLTKQLYDMTALEEGKPTERTENTERKNIFAQFQVLVAELKNKKAGPDEIGAENTGLGGGNSLPLNGQVTIEAAAELLPPADNKSEGLETAPQVEAKLVPDLVPDSEPIPGQIQTPGGNPGGGDAPAGGPGSASTDESTRNFSGNESSGAL